MFAVIRTGGKQYRVQEGDVLDIERLEVEASQKVVFEEVLLIEDDKKTLIGTPFIENAAVRAEVLENFKDKKVLVFKKKRRKQYRRTKGHRQQLSRVRIEQIIPSFEVKAKKEALPKAKPKEEIAKKPDVIAKKKPVKKAEKAEAIAAKQKPRAAKKPVAKRPAAAKKSAKVKEKKSGT